MGMYEIKNKTHLVIATFPLCINYFNLLIKEKHSCKSALPFLRSTFDSCRKWESVAVWGEEGPFKILINVLHIRGRMLTCMKLGGTGAKRAALTASWPEKPCLKAFQKASHSHDPSGKLFILDSRSLNCFSVLQKSCPACQRTHRQLRFTQQHHQVDIVSNNQVCWKQNRTKDNVNEKMTNTARCLQLSMQIHTTYIALFFSKKSNAVTCQRWNVHLIMFLNTSVVSGGGKEMNHKGFIILIIWQLWIKT